MDFWNIPGVNIGCDWWQNESMLCCYLFMSFAISPLMAALVSYNDHFFLSLTHSLALLFIVTTASRDHPDPRWEVIRSGTLSPAPRKLPRYECSLRFLIPQINYRLSEPFSINHGRENGEICVPSVCFGRWREETLINDLVGSGISSIRLVATAINEFSTRMPMISHLRRKNRIALQNLLNPWVLERCWKTISTVFCFEYQPDNVSKASIR